MTHTVYHFHNDIRTFFTDKSEARCYPKVGYIWNKKGKLIARIKKK